MVIATEITCSPNATAELCPNTTLLCTCAGTGTAVRWTTNKTGVFVPPTGVSLVADFDNVGDSHTQGGFTVVLVNKTMNNFISTLQVDSSDVNGVQVSCSIGGVSDIITPQLAGELSKYKYFCLSAHVLKAYNYGSLCNVCVRVFSRIKMILLSHACLATTLL